MMELKSKEDELHSKTIEHAEKVLPTIRIKPDEPRMKRSEIKMQMSILAIDEKDYATAENVLNDVIRNTNNTMTKLMALETLGNVYRTTKNFKGLSYVLSRLTTLRQHPDDYVEHGNVLLMLKQFDDAKNKYIKGAELSIGHESRARCYALAYVSTVLNGKPEQDLLLRAVRSSPDATVKMLRFLEEGLNIPKSKLAVYHRQVVDIMNAHEGFKEKLKMIVPVKV